MFRSRRTSTYKLLWRAAAKRRASSTTPTPGVAGGPTTAGTRPPTHHQAWLDDPVTKTQLHAFLKKLSETDLESLQRCVLSNGADLAPCIFLDPAPFLAARAEDPPLAPTPLAPHLLACRTWRWPDLEAEAQLRHLHSLCPGQDASGRVCCNPHHWSRRCLPESPPPAYSRLPLPLAANCCYPPSMLGVENVCRSTTPPPPESQETHGSLPLGSTGADGVRVRPWATLAYWEGRKRVGRLLPVNTPAVAVFASKGAGPPQPGSQALGLCLATLTQATPPESEHVRRTRDKIGLGALLEKVGGEVWLYNRSDWPIFVHSPTLDPPPATPTARTLVVYKVPPGYALRIHDEDRALLNQQLARRGRAWDFASEESTTTSVTVPATNGKAAPSYFSAVSPQPPGTASSQGYGACSAQEWTEFSDGPYDPNAVRISFAKGWGPKYSRQFITSCPCWLEVLLAMPCR